MSSVAMDIFRLPAVIVDSIKYDAIALCVDRLSGWIIAEPGEFDGMTADWVAKKCINIGVFWYS